jgi:hypothetical protein
MRCEIFIKRNIFLILVLLTIGLYGECARSANSNAGQETFPYNKVVKDQMKIINKFGHPIFITACRQNSKHYIIVITNPSTQGFLAVLHDNNVVDLASISTSGLRHAFIVETNGGRQRAAEMHDKFKILSKLPFHILAKLSYKELISYPTNMTCRI